MILRRKRDLIASVAEHWKQSYWTEQRGWCPYSPTCDKEAIYKALCELPSNATEDVVTRVIGNDSWTRNGCHECGQQKDVVVVLGEIEDYESATAYLCIDCLRSAVVYFEDHAHQP